MSYGEVRLRVLWIVRSAGLASDRSLLAILYLSRESTAWKAAQASKDWPIRYSGCQLEAQTGPPRL